MKYDLVNDCDNNKGQKYLELMRSEIEWEKQELDLEWKELESDHHAKLPTSKAAEPVIPSIEEWSLAQITTGWVPVEEGVYRSLEKVPTPKIKIAASMGPLPADNYLYKHYDDFSSEFQKLCNYQNLLLIWEWQVNEISKHDFDLSYLEKEGIFYTEALFLRLGFHPKSLKNQLYFGGFTMFNCTEGKSGCLLSNWLIANAPEVDSFNRNEKLQKELITTKALIKEEKDAKILKNSKSSRTSNANRKKALQNDLRNEDIVAEYTRLNNDKNKTHLSKRAKAEIIKRKLDLPILPRAILNVINNKVANT